MVHPHTAYRLLPGLNVRLWRFCWLREVMVAVEEVGDKRKVQFCISMHNILEKVGYTETSPMG